MCLNSVRFLHSPNMIVSKEVRIFNSTFATLSLINSYIIEKYKAKIDFIISCGLLCLVVIVFIAIGMIIITLDAGKRYQNLSQNEYYNGAVVTNGLECSSIGGSVFQKGGSVADAAIAAMICEGIVMPHSAGLGGGFVMTMFIKNSSQVRTLRSTDSIAYQKGVMKTVTVPGELKGLWTLHQEYGKLPWKALMEPSIQLCEEGFEVSNRLARFFHNYENFILKEPTLAEIFFNPETLRTYQQGEILRRPILAKFLKDVANEGIEIFYNGSYSQGFIEDIKKISYIEPINESIIRNFQVQWDEAISTKLLNNITLYTSSLPSSGPFLAFILNILKQTEVLKDTANMWYIIVETFKYAFGQRIQLNNHTLNEVNRMYKEMVGNLVSDSSYLVKTVLNRLKLNRTLPNSEMYGVNADKNVFESDAGGSHICALAPNGDAIAMSSTLNAWFGMGKRSRSTGIILGKQFNSKTNAPQFNINSMVPVILLDDQANVRLIISSGGGSKMITSTALILLRYLWFNENLHQVIMTPKLHHQLFPMEIDVDDNFDTNTLAVLSSMGFRLSYHLQEEDLTSTTAIAVENGLIKGEFDCTKKGSAYYVL